MNQKSKTVDDVIADLESDELPENHPRRLARKAVAQYRRTAAIDPDYDFSKAPRQARQTIYDMTVKYSAQHSWWARLRRR